MNKKSRGAWGEQIALDFLEKKGYIILDRNLWSAAGEIDIIARDTDTTVFVEVKVITAYGAGELEQIVSEKKQERIRNCALLYLKQQYGTIEMSLRFDVIAIHNREEILHVENAF
ncbi:MAG: YraN family protein [Spirochaetales bacterium]|nr:YraN family protein [Spirochaetales bacterium]